MEVFSHASVCALNSLEIHRLPELCRTPQQMLPHPCALEARRLQDAVLIGVRKTHDLSQKFWTEKKRSYGMEVLIKKSLDNYIH